MSGASLVEPAPPSSAPVMPTAGGSVAPASGLPTGIAPPPPSGSKRGAIVETIILVMVSLIAVTGIVFAAYFYMQWDDARTDVNGQIAAAEAVARDLQRQEDEEIFAEREKQPYLQFTGPLDYGALGFVYPRTWSIYIENDAAKGGDFNAYFNPVQVNPVSLTTINALRVSILNRSIDDVRTSYDGMVRSGQLAHSVFRVGSITADRYDGEVAHEVVGAMIMFKINDKTAILRTDAKIFQKDFDELIKTIKLN